MTRPHTRPSAALSASLAGAVDLAAVKARTEAAQNKSTSDAGSTSQWVFEVTEETFQTEVVERSLDVPVIVDLWATWCEPCKQLSPMLERLAAAAGGAWVLAKIDVDANPRIAQIFGVQSIPTVVAIAGGQPVNAFTGALPEAEIKQWLNSLLDALRDQLPGIRAAEQNADSEEIVEVEEDQRFVAAEEAVQRGDFAAAESAYQHILAEEPANADARAALAQVKFMKRVATVEPDAVARADAAPLDVEAQCFAADLELANQQPDIAFTRLIKLIQRAAGDDRDRARQHLVELFELFPADDPVVVKARRNLASALF